NLQLSQQPPPSQSSFPATTIPSPHTVVHADCPDGCVEEQVQPSSTLQVEEQPSPEAVFPSSHSSNPWVRTPSPQRKSVVVVVLDVLGVELEDVEVLLLVEVVLLVDVLDEVVLDVEEEVDVEVLLLVEVVSLVEVLLLVEVVSLVEVLLLVEVVSLVEVLLL